MTDSTTPKDIAEVIASVPWDCPRCFGRGFHWAAPYGSNDTIPQMIKCIRCHGTGRLVLRQPILPS